MHTNKKQNKNNKTPNIKRKGPDFSVLVLSQTLITFIFLDLSSAATMRYLGRCASEVYPCWVLCVVAVIPKGGSSW